MGVSLTPILKKREVAFTELQGKVLAVDGFNILYQFLTTIRARDGTPLTDSNGNVTSHLIGLFNRTTNLMSQGMKLVFVFDGEAPKLKQQERERRQALKQDAQTKFDAAQAAEDVDAMRKYAGRTARLTPEMLDEAKKLLDALGIPVIQAPSEGEAQAAHMVKQGDAYAVISQDADAFLFGAPRVIRNLAITGRKKKAGTMAYEPLLPELVDLKETLKELDINQEQLIVLAVLTGTDFAPGGVKGLGPKKGLKLVKEHDLKAIPELAKWHEHQDVKWDDVLDVFHNIPTTDDYELKWKKPDTDAIKQLLVEQHDFNADRVDSTLEKLDDGGQTGLGQYF